MPLAKIKRAEIIARTKLRPVLDRKMWTQVSHSPIVAVFEIEPRSLLHILLHNSPYTDFNYCIFTALYKDYA